MLVIKQTTRVFATKNTSQTQNNRDENPVLSTSRIVVGGSPIWIRTENNETKISELPPKGENFRGYILICGDETLLLHDRTTLTARSTLARLSNVT